MAQIENQLSTALGYSASVIQSWRKPTGNLPGLPALERLVEALVKSGGLQTPSEAKALLIHGNHPYPDEVCARLFGDSCTAEKPHAANGGLVQPEKLAPFVIGQPVFHPRQFFGRQVILRRIFDSIQHLPLPNIAIVGPKRSGKTSLLKFIKNIAATPPEDLRANQHYDWFPRENLCRWLFVDFQDGGINDLVSFLRFLLVGFNLPIPEKISLGSFMETTRYQIHTPTIVLLDEVELGMSLPEINQTRLWNSLRSLAGNASDGKLGFITASGKKPEEMAELLAGPSSPFFNTFGYTHWLGPFSETEALELIASSPTPFRPADIDWMMQESQRWPVILQTFCTARLFMIEDEGDEWKSEALRQIVSYRHLLNSAPS